MDAKKQLKLNCTFDDLEDFLGYLIFAKDKGQLRPYVQHEFVFRAEDDATVIVPPDSMPVGLLFWDALEQKFRVQTVLPDQEDMR